MKEIRDIRMKVRINDFIMKKGEEDRDIFKAASPNKKVDIKDMYIKDCVYPTPDMHTLDAQSPDMTLKLYDNALVMMEWYCTPDGGRTHMRHDGKKFGNIRHPVAIKIFYLGAEYESKCERKYFEMQYKTDL